MRKSQKALAVFLTAVLSLSSVLLLPMGASAAGSIIEFEQGRITDTGENKTSVVSLTGAGGGKAVDLKDSGDSVTVDVTVPSAGSYKLTIRYSQPYDENGKYQNVLVNGGKAGLIICAYTGENSFKTVTISADLKAGKNTVTVEGDWGWVYLDSLTVEGAAAKISTFTSNPIISRNVPAYSNAGDAKAGNDAVYYTSWDTSAPDQIAYDLSSVPASQRKTVLAVWYNGSTFDRVGRYITVDSEPTDYVIEVNTAAGGAYPKDGWTTAVEIKGNTLSTRSHLVEMNGANWIRMRVTGAEGGKISLNLDIHDASQGNSDSWIFYGDSITAGGMGNAWGTSFASHVHELDASLMPMQQNGGIGGISSTEGREHIDAWLAATAAHYVSIAYGTNDSWGNMNSTDLYYTNTKYMIDAVLKAGKVPVLPKIPYASNPDVGKYVGDHNAVIDRLYVEYGDNIVHGPDFEQYFKANPSGLSDDGVHPNADGYEAMRKLWAETMYENVYSQSTSCSLGDVDGNGTVDVLDVVMLQKWLVNAGALNVPQAADLNQDGSADIFDMALLKRMLLTPQTAPAEPGSDPEPAPTPTVTPEAYMNQIRDQIVNRLPAGAADHKNGVDYGEMRFCTYWSKTRGRETPVRVLLPAGYNENETYPVLYLLHGYWNDETTLSDPDSGLQNIIGNLIASGEAKKMIVVFPYIYTSKTMPYCTGMDWENNQNYDNFIYDLEADLMPWMEQNFSIKTGREHTGISGFSMGARESFYIGVRMSDRFGYVGSVCTAPGLSPGMLDTKDLKFAQQPYMMLLSGAVYDGVVGNNPENYHNILSGNGVPHIWNSLPDGGHDNNSIQPHVYNLVKFAFQAE
ncbi:MAG: hypothetical protein II916_07230 [Oscillospiraceae bacterium]|nr:hypothetical protein [Oscillospiraceae bacterium]